MTLGKEDWGDILRKKRLHFKNNKELEKYYEQKYAEGGYKGGYILWGINYSSIYQKVRQKNGLELLMPNKKDRILDAGCGDGSLSLQIARKAKKVFGIDIAENAFRKAKKHAPKNLKFLKGNIEQTKLKSGMLDKIICIEALEHVLHPEKALREFNRLLKPGGMLILTYPTIDQTIIAKIERFLRIRKLTPVSEHITGWDYKTVIGKAEKQGFKFLEFKGISFDLGRIENMAKLSKSIAQSMLNFRLRINFPKNSYFVAFRFKKV